MKIRPESRPTPDQHVVHAARTEAAVHDAAGSAATSVFDAGHTAAACLGIEVKTGDEIRIAARGVLQLHRRQRQGARQRAVAPAVDEDGAILQAALQENAALFRR